MSRGSQSHAETGQQSEIAQVARLASTESQAERRRQQQQRQHEQQVEDIQRDANRRITGKGKHKTAPVDSPSPTAKAKTSPPMEAQPLPPTPAFPLNPVQLPPPDTGASSSSSAPAPKAKAKAKAMATSRKGTKKEADNPEGLTRKTRAGRSASPEPEHAGKGEDNRSRSRAKSAPAHDTYYDNSMENEYWVSKPRTYLVDQLRKRYYNAHKDDKITKPKATLTEINKMKVDKLKELMRQWIDDNAT